MMNQTQPDILSRSNLTLNSAENILDKASELINVCYDADRRFNDLKFKLRLEKLDQPTVSGLNDHDYPKYDSLNFGACTEFVCVRKNGLPPELCDQISRMECNFAMGLFPEVNRAWVTVDSSLFVWNYDSNCDLAYDQVANTILMLNLSRPKANTLTNVQFILSVVTSVDIVLLGVNFLDQNGVLTENFQTAEMHMLPDPFFKCSLDGMIVADIKSMDDGRIFLAGRDGCLYQIKYQSGGLFGRYCKKINHSKGIMSYLVPSVVAFTFGKDEPLSEICMDKSRQILYTRSELGSIHVFDVQDQQVAKISHLSGSEIQYTASRIVQTVDQSHFKPIVSISVIDNDESDVLNLVGVTKSGVRLYFTCYYNIYVSTMTKHRPETLKLVHVRFPPGFCPSSSSIRPERVHKMFTSRETSLIVSAYDEQTDLLSGFSNAHFPFRVDFMETQTQLPIKGRTWVLDEVKHSKKKSCVTNRDCAQPPSVAKQHNEPPKHFVILTPQAYFFIERLRPVDILRYILVEHGPDSQNTRMFFQLHQPSQAGAMCLILACSTSQHERQVSDRALRALYMYGGEAKMIATQDLPIEHGLDGSFYSPKANRAPIIHTTSTPAHTIVATQSSLIRPPFSRSNADWSTTNEMGGAGDLSLTASTSTNQRATKAPQQCSDVKFSDRHNAFYLYFSRVLANIWQSNVVAERTIKYPNKKSIDVLDSTLTSEEVSCVVEQVRNFVELMKNNAGLPPAIVRQTADLSFATHNVYMYGNDTINSAATSNVRNNAEIVEQQSLVALFLLAQRCAEVLGLLKVIVDHQMHVIIALLPQEQQEKLRVMTFNRVVIDGKELCSDLVLCLMNQYLADRATTDYISARLRQVCPSLFTSDDATSAKANELLVTSKSSEDDQERKQAMDKALVMYKKIANQIHLPTVCSQLEESHSFDAIVDLCICAANKIDPTDVAIQFYRRQENEMEEDTLRKQIFVNRLLCYKCITDAMNRLFNASTGNHPTIPAHQAKAWLDSMIKLAINDTSDELCHVTVFDWLFERRLLGDAATRGIAGDSPHLETYLRRRAADAAHTAECNAYLDLLWQLYERQRRFGSAADVLSQLAERHGQAIELSQRVTHLSRAVLCCKASSDLSSSQAEFWHDLEDKLEVAKLQMQILEALKQLPQSGEVRNAVLRLNIDLLDVTQLYTDYADNFKLGECKLAIVICAGHHDPTLVEGLWRDIIDKELTLHCREATLTRAKLLADKIRSLIKQYADSPRFLPLSFIIKYLFAKSVDNNFEPRWIVETMASCSVSCLDISSVLDTTFKQWTNTAIKKDRRMQIYVLKALGELMADFHGRTDGISVKERSKVKNTFLDAIALYVVELDTMPSGTESNFLKRKFMDLQSSLENDR